MISRRKLIRASLLAGAAATLAACSGGSKPPPVTGKPSPTSSALVDAGKRGLQIGAKIPEVTSEAISGPEIELRKYRGHPLLINFWAVDCEPCVREFPLLKAAILKKSDLPIVGVNVMDRKEEAQAFIEKQDATWPSIWDPDGSIARENFRVTVLPVTLAVGRNFTLVDRIFGEVDKNRLESMIEAIYQS